jgi:hypothetical protein
MAYGTLVSDLLTNSNGQSASTLPPAFRNRIINGDMRIDQRNAGAAVTINTTGQTYTVDRWRAYGVTSAGVYTVQQNSGSVTLPTGYINYLGAKTTTADASVAAGSYYFLSQLIEGLNVADLGWGTANAKTITLSFQVYSSLTGTFGGSVTNNAFNRSYPFTYTISSANTWTSISVTIAGDTSGTWLTTTGNGIGLYFDLGSGSSNVGTAGAWAAAGYVGATGDTKVIGTLNATFYITGVQLEVGSSATTFDFRDYGRELMLCQRYTSSTFQIGTAWAQNAGAAGAVFNGAITSGFGTQMVWRFPVPMRTAPTVTSYNPAAANANGRNYAASVDVTFTVNPFGNNSTNSYTGTVDVQAGASGQSVAIHYSASAEL